MIYKKYQNKLSFRNKLKRLLWNFCYTITFRPFSLPFFNSYRTFILRLFGAKIGQNCKIDSKVRIWAPWNLETGNLVAIGFDTLIYNPGKISIGNKVTISQRAHLCSASHDYTYKSNPLITEPIRINDLVWISADAFIGMGVIINLGAIVGARAAVFKDIEPWTIVGGNPAKFIKKRIINE